VLLQKASKDDASTEGHDCEGDGQVDKWKTPESNCEQYERDRYDETGHFESHEPTLWRSTQAHGGAWQKRSRDGGCGHQPEIHDRRSI
jgi:hypothetical protein